MSRLSAILLSIVIAAVFFAGVAWILWRWLKHSQDAPGRLVSKWILSAVVIGGTAWFIRGVPKDDMASAFIVPITGAVCGLILAVIWGQNIVGLIARPFENLFTGGGTPPEPEPFYSIAIAKRKKGQYREAASDIQRQLEKFPHDVFGQMLLAEIQVQHLNDLPGAELTIHRLVAQPGHAPKNISFALGTLADWHLKYGVDVVAAQAALQQIIDRLPGTEEAALAAHRIAHLGTQEHLMAAREMTPVQLKEGVQNIGLMKDSSALRRSEADPAEVAEQYVQHLTTHPFDSETRERLALIYAEHFERLDLATDQLEQLVQQPNQPAKLLVHYLNTLADLHIKHGNDLVAATGVLERIIALNPAAAAATLAQSRIDHLKLELRKNEKSQVMKLGSYEQNIGLRKKS